MLTAVAALVVAVSLPSRAGAATPVPYPDGYRHWTHVKTMQIHAGHPLFDAFGGIHHVYANRKAIAGYERGRFADGAILVFDLREAITTDNVTVPGSRKALAVMQRDSKRFADTGGWGFEAFARDSTSERLAGANARSACFECHAAKAAETGYVFSRFER